MKKNKLLIISLLGLSLIACKGQTPTSSKDESSSNVSNVEDSLNPSGEVSSSPSEKAIFPMEEINSYFNQNEEIPAYVADSYKTEFGLDQNGYKLFDISSPISATSCASEYEKIVKANNLEVFSENNEYYYASKNNIYFLFFGEDSNLNLFYVDIYLYEEFVGSSEDVIRGTSTTFPLEEINKFYGVTDTIPTPTGTTFEYEAGATGYGYDCFTVLVSASECSYAQYKTICTNEGIQISEGTSSGTTFADFYTVGGKYEVQFYEETNVLYINVYLAETSSEVVTGTSTTFPMEEINKFYGVTDTIPTPTGTTFEYEAGDTGYGYDYFTVLVSASECSYAQYLSICKDAGLTVTESEDEYGAFADYTSTNGKYQVQFYEEQNVLVIAVYLAQ